MQSEIDELIDAKAAAIAADSPGVPPLVIRNLITARAGGCECRQYLELKRQDDEAAAREDAA